MKSFSLSHLQDHVLLRELAELVTQDRVTTAALLAHLAEVDERRLYLPAAYPSMYLYCVRELHMSEDMALKRIQSARAARKFPAIFPALAAGRLHLSAVVQLAPHLTPDNADELLAAAAHKTKAEIELLLAERFPRPDVPTLVQAIVPAPASAEHAPGHVGALDIQLSPGTVVPSIEPIVALHMEPPTPRAKIAPLAPERFALQVTVDKETHVLLRYVQSLLGHAVPSGDVAEVLKRALKLMAEKLEQQKLAATVRSRPRRSKANGRYIPAEIRRAVWQRDHGQCTFVSERGQRCAANTRLELDHVSAVARGGQTTANNLRLRCRAHNPYAADCTFGAGFMKRKRQAARSLKSGLAPICVRHESPNTIAPA